MGLAQRVGVVALVVAGLGALAGGCAPTKAVTTLDQGGAVAKEATKMQLLANLELNMARIQSLKAKATVEAVKQDMFLPATAPDAVRKLAGKPYRKRFFETDVNSLMQMMRTPEGGRQIYFGGQIIDANVSFKFLSQDNAFWIIWPNMDRENADKDQPRGYVYYGAAERQVIRPKDIPSMRPYDIWDLLMTDEAVLAMHEQSVCFMETWPNYYILDFLTPTGSRGAEVTLSKIWIERKGLTMEIHQMFDSAGTVVAEGRFGDYKAYPVQTNKGDRVPVALPSKVMFFWPKDELILYSELSNVTLNDIRPIEEQKFRPVVPPGYKEVEITLSGQPGAGTSGGVPPLSLPMPPATPEAPKTPAR